MINFNMNMIGEAIGLFFSILFFCFMVFTRPRMTKIFIVDILGLFLSILTTFLHLQIIRLVDFPANFNPASFNILSIVYFGCYTIVINLIFTYVRLLSYEHHISVRILVTLEALFLVIACIYFAYNIYNGNAYTFDGTSLILTSRYKDYLLLGMFAAFVCLIVSAFSRGAIARIEFTYLLVFVPIELVLLVIQYCFTDAQFISITYSTPFIIFYVLFHSNPYDEVSGCQNKYSFETQFVNSSVMHRNFMIVNVILPKGRLLDYNYLQEQVTHIAADKCRKIEKLDRSIRIYSLNNYNYAAFISNPTPERSEYIINKIQEIMNSPTKYAIHNDIITYKMIAFKSHPFIDSTQKLGSMQRYLFSKLGHDLKSEQYIATESDYEAFINLYQVEMLLNDIKEKGNLDDARVLCYAQPIYCVETGTFRTAEALMRLELDGKIIYPDKFISVAEQNGCIHTLTCIILNKVCKMIKSMEDSFDFDAITINCSAMEFSNKNLHNELLMIMRQNEVPCSKIRIELTESAISDDSDSLIINVNSLRESGVQFYLDDFGTGYSNLERIIGCPFNTIKFDKSLLYKSIDDERMDDLIISMASVFKKQGFTLLVEGVETDEQTQYCLVRGFSYIQGYKYAKPQPIENLKQYFQAVKNKPKQKCVS